MASDDVKNAAKDIADDVGEATGTARATAKDAMKNAGDTARDYAARASDTVRNVADRLPDGASDAVAAGQRAYNRGSDVVGRQVAKQPIEALLLAGAIGYLVGWATNRG